MKKKLTLILLIAVACAMMPMTASAASKVKMKTYSDVVKSGNTVYCTSTLGIWKVKVTKSGKVKSKKWLLSPKKGYSFDIRHMKKKGHYLYYLAQFGGTSRLYRTNLSTGKRKLVAYDVVQYVIRKNKIYTVHFDIETEEYYNRVMKLNGKSKKKSSVRPVDKLKKSNAKGYSVISRKADNDYEKVYLKTPKGKYYLGKAREY